MKRQQKVFLDIGRETASMLENPDMVKIQADEWKREVAQEVLNDLDLLAAQINTARATLRRALMARRVA